MVAKDSLKKATFPSSARGSGWILASDLERRIDAATKIMTSGESDVVTAYHKNVFHYIVPIVSVLEFPSSSWDTQFLEVTISHSRRGSQQNNYAVPDSVLKVNPGRHHESTMSHSGILEDMKIIAKYFDQIILPFEFKSLSSGSYDTMLGILWHTTSEGDFPWEGCSEPQYCAYEHGPRLGRKPVTGDPVGFDAVLPGLNFHISEWDGENRRTLNAIKDKAKSKRHARDMLQQVCLRISLFHFNLLLHAHPTDMGPDG